MHSSNVSFVCSGRSNVGFGEIWEASLCSLKYIRDAQRRLRTAESGKTLKEKEGVGINPLPYWIKVIITTKSKVGNIIKSNKWSCCDKKVGVGKQTLERGSAPRWSRSQASSETEAAQLRNAFEEFD